VARKAKQKSGAPKSKQSARPEPRLPGRDEILAFIKQSQDKVGKREITRAFGLKGPQRAELKALLRDMTDEGLITGNRKGMHKKGGLPAVAMLDVTGVDGEDDLVAAPANWDEHDGPVPRVVILPQRGGASSSGGGRRGRSEAIGVGDRVLARLSELESDDPADNPEGYHYKARPIKRLARAPRSLLGIFRNRGAGGVIDPIDRKQLKEWPVTPNNTGDAKDGDLVRFELNKRGRYGIADAAVVAAFGNPQDQKQISLIAVHAHGIPDEFPKPVLDELQDLKTPTLSGRTDLRHLPLVTIDPSDARDHDDAVHAGPDPDPKNEGGFIVTVAIADVAFHVTPGSLLDAEAQSRGNSCYFPDRVVPMLPELISNDLCSLREKEPRPCLAVQMVFNAKGDKIRHKFLRAMMRSAAKLSYEEAQAAIDGKPSDKAGPLLEPVLKPLWAAYRLLDQARQRRGPLDLNLPERKIILDDNGEVARIVVPERLDAHKLIEECMIQANVAAAETLEAKKTPVVYRVHDQPSKEKLKNLKDFLETLDIKFPVSGTLRPAQFNKILHNAKSMPSVDLVNEVVLRSQAQAEYNIHNCGHFGLNLRRYAHFTSPIRRYADLLVHRALIRALKLGEDGLSKQTEARLADIAQAISDAERRAMAAERETSDRLIAAHLADRVGASFPARISGVTKSGLFVRLADSGADGFVPASTLGDEFYHYQEVQHAMVGERSGRAFRLGDDVEVKLIEAIAMAGALRFEMLSQGKRGHVSLDKRQRPKRRGPTRGRGPRRRR